MGSIALSEVRDRLDVLVPVEHAALERGLVGVVRRSDPRRRRRAGRGRPAARSRLISGARSSVRLPRRMVPICVSEPTGSARPRRIELDAGHEGGRHGAQPDDQYAQAFRSRARSGEIEFDEILCFQNDTSLRRTTSTAAATGPGCGPCAPSAPPCSAGVPAALANALWPPKRRMMRSAGLRSVAFIGRTVTVFSLLGKSTCGLGQFRYFSEGCVNAGRSRCVEERRCRERSLRTCT